MIHGSALRCPQPDHYAPVEPRLELLPQVEPGSRIFVRNLLDLILRREEPPLFIASQPVVCRRHFYIRTGVRKTAIFESLGWHIVIVPLLLLLWNWSMKSEFQRFPLQSSKFTQSEPLTYDPPSGKFPARQGRQIKQETASPAETSPQDSIHVAEEQRASEIKAPEVTLGRGAQAEISSANPEMPAVPIAATSRSQLILPGDLNKVIGPAPSVQQLSTRTFTSAGAAVVAPAPQIAGIGGRNGISLPATVVAPAPQLQGSLGHPGIATAGIGSAGVAPPAPNLAIAGINRGRGNGTLAASGVAVVPPSPTVRGRVFLPGGSGNLISGNGTQVVAPVPSVEHGLVLAGGRGNSLAGAGTQIVPPAPSIRAGALVPGSGGKSVGGLGTSVVPPAPSLGLGNGRGRGVAAADGKGDSLAGGGVPVVPPTPSIGAGSGGSGGRGHGRSFAGLGGGSVVSPAPNVGGLSTHGGGRGGDGMGTITGNGAQVVGPAPSIASAGGGNGFGGRGGNGLSAEGFGTQALPPGNGSGASGNGGGGGNAASGSGAPGAGQSAGGSGGSGSNSSSGSGNDTVAGLAAGPAIGAGAHGGSAATPIISTAVPPHVEIPEIPAGQTAVVPMRVIQLALALPMTSYFSNYEAFLAERSVNRKTTQLIKLVYTFLPYQRRLTEFGLNTSKTFNLRVTRDPSCDESLINMTWPDDSGHPPAEESDKDKLPCYRTTADDYRKAWEKAR